MLFLKEVDLMELLLDLPFGVRNTVKVRLALFFDSSSTVPKLSSDSEDGRVLRQNFIPPEWYVVGEIVFGEPDFFEPKSLRCPISAS